MQLYTVFWKEVHKIAHIDVNGLCVQQGNNKNNMFLRKKSN